MNGNSSKRQLINEPKSMQAKLAQHQDNFEYPKNLLPPSKSDDMGHGNERYRSQSEGQKLIKHIEESLESISQYMKISDSSQSLQNTIQIQQLSNHNSFARSKVNMGQLINQCSPMKDQKSRDSSLTEKFKASARQIDDLTFQFRREKLQWEEEKRSLQEQLDEAIQINSKLLDKVKRLEVAVREKTK